MSAAIFVLDPLMSLTQLANDAINAMWASMLVKGGTPAPKIIATGGVVAMDSSCSRQMLSSNTSPVLVVILVLVVSSWENSCC